MASSAFCDETINVKSTAKETNKQEIIQLEVIPVVDTYHNPINTEKINKNPVYVAPLIAPAQEEKPTLNFNLNNIKNVKKGAILPSDNVNQTLTNVVQYFNAPYEHVFAHLVSIIDNTDLELVSFDSKSGRIFANYRHMKPIYITVSQYNSENIIVKITPADGVYDIPANITDKIFSDLSKSLAIK